MPRDPVRSREILFIFGVALLLRLIRLDHTPQWDELYHALAASSLLSDGTFSIGDGAYYRSAGYTAIVAAFMAIGGESLVVARLPAVLSGALLVALIYAWVTREAGRRSGLFAAGLLCTLPLAVQQSQFVRFYALHALLLSACAWLLFDNSLRAAETRARVFAGLGFVLMLLFALHLQIAAVIGVIGMGLWVVLQNGANFWERLKASRHRNLLVSGAGAALVAGLAAAWALGIVEWGVFNYRFAPAWAQNTLDDYLFYHRWLFDEYPLLWAGFPIAALVARRRARELTLFCSLVFCVAFVLHSFAGPKSKRFLLYAMPFFFAIWGVAISHGIELVLRVVRARAPSARETFATAMAWIAIGATALIVAYVNPAFRTSFDMLRLSDAQWYAPQWYRGYADWESAAKAIAPLQENASALVSGSAAKALYFMGRADYEISATNREETKDRAEFGRDLRSGTPVISTPESLRLIMTRHETGVVIIETARWRRAVNVPDEIADTLEAETKRVELPEEWRLMLFKWGPLEPFEAMR